MVCYWYRSSMNSSLLQWFAILFLSLLLILIFTFITLFLFCCEWENLPCFTIYIPFVIKITNFLLFAFKLRLILHIIAILSLCICSLSDQAVFEKKLIQDLLEKLHQLLAARRRQFLSIEVFFQNSSPHETFLKGT